MHCVQCSCSFWISDINLKSLPFLAISQQWHSTTTCGLFNCNTESMVTQQSIYFFVRKVVHFILDWSLVAGNSFIYFRSHCPFRCVQNQKLFSSQHSKCQRCIVATLNVPVVIYDIDLFRECFDRANLQLGNWQKEIHIIFPILPSNGILVAASSKW